MFDRSAGLTWDAALELLSWKEEGGWATAKAPAASRIANPFEISCNQRFTALNPIPAPSACYETDRKSMSSLRDGLPVDLGRRGIRTHRDRKSTRLNSSHLVISYAVFCLKKK